jgi:hypothetical protein
LFFIVDASPYRHGFALGYSFYMAKAKLSAMPLPRPRTLRIDGIISRIEIRRTGALAGFGKFTDNEP